MRNELIIEFCLLCMLGLSGNLSNFVYLCFHAQLDSWVLYSPYALSATYLFLLKLSPFYPIDNIDTLTLYAIFV